MHPLKGSEQHFTLIWNFFLFVTPKHLALDATPFIEYNFHLKKTPAYRFEYLLVLFYNTSFIFVTVIIVIRACFIV